MRFLIAILLFISAPLIAMSQTTVKLSNLKNHIGDSVIVEGQVKTITHKNSSLTPPTLITIGDGPNLLTVVIGNAVRNKFSVKPEDAYRNKSIRISGRLLNNNGKMQIVISNPSQIVLIDHK